MRSSFFTISDNRSSVNKKKARPEEKRPPQQSMFIPRNSAWRRLFFRSAINKKARQKAGAWRRLFFRSAINKKARQKAGSVG